MALQVRNSSGNSVTGVYQGARIRLYISGIAWPHVGFSIIDANRKTFLANTNVDVSALGTAWLDITAPTNLGTYKLYAYSDYGGAGTHEYLAFSVIAPPDTNDGQDNADSDQKPEAFDWASLKPYLPWIGLAIAVVWLVIFALPDKK
jgi:hypothetical protein